MEVHSMRSSRSLLFLPLSVLALAACAQAPQQQPSTQQPPASRVPAADPDPTIAVSAGAVPAGWTVRLDDKDQGRFTVNDTRFVTMGDGFHVTSGPAALYYRTEGLPNAPYSVEATFTRTRAPQHPEAYGLFMGGRNLEDSQRQDYIYFLVRGDGQYNISHRGGTEVHRVVAWTPHPAVRRAAADGSVTDALRINVGADSVRFVANGQQVAAIARTQVANVGGNAGLRVNHNLDVHVSNFRVTR
jgi:hypothetical protein